MVVVVSVVLFIATGDEAAIFTHVTFVCTLFFFFDELDVITRDFSDLNFIFREKREDFGEVFKLEFWEEIDSQKKRKKNPKKKIRAFFI